MTPEQFTEELKQRLGSHLQSVILYGSAAVGDQTKLYSNIILIVLETLNIAVLDTISSLISQWRKKGHPTPLFLTHQFIQDATDVFPIDFMDIKASHRVLFGDNPFQNLVVDQSNLRHQLEFELRSKLIQLETRFIEADGKEKQIKEFISRALSSITALFKAVLKFKGDQTTTKRRDVWAALSARVPIDMTAFEEILKIREGGKLTIPARELASRLFDSVQRVIEFVDH